MNFPKEVMTTTELVKCGLFTRHQIDQLLNRKGQNYAFRITPRGNWKWDTVRLQRHLDRHPLGL